ncbi:MAG: hypothetical protein ACO3GP_06025, partial [Candidatus Limnocylindrus sp.]
AMSVTVGGRNLVLPSAATLRGELSQESFNQAIKQARAQAEIADEFQRKALDEANQKMYAVARDEYGVREKYDPKKDYARVIQNREKQRERAAARAQSASQGITPYQQAQLALDLRRLELEEKKFGVREQDAEWRRNKLPVAAQNKLSLVESGVIMSKDLRQAIQENPDALGLRNLVWGQIVNRLDPQGVGVRASVEALTGEIRYMRFAGALTEVETKFAERFLPDATDRADAALSKLESLEKFLEQRRQGIYIAYGGSYTPMGSAQGNAAAASAQTSPAPRVGADTTSVRRDSVAAPATAKPSAMDQLRAAAGVDSASATPRRDSVLAPAAPAVAPDTGRTVARPAAPATALDTMTAPRDSAVAPAAPSREYAREYAALATMYNQELAQATTEAERVRARRRYDQAVMGLAKEQQAEATARSSAVAAPSAPAIDTMSVARNLVPGATAPLDTAAIRRGEEIGMPKRPSAPAPRYRPVLENPMSPEGINEIPMPAMAPARSDTLRRALQQGGQVTAPSARNQVPGATAPVAPPTSAPQIPQTLGMMDRAMALALLSEYQDVTSELQSGELSPSERRTALQRMRELEKSLRRLGVIS